MQNDNGLLIPCHRQARSALSFALRAEKLYNWAVSQKVRMELEEEKKADFGEESGMQSWVSGSSRVLLGGQHPDGQMAPLLTS